MYRHLRVYYVYNCVRTGGRAHGRVHRRARGRTGARTGGHARMSGGREGAHIDTPPARPRPPHPYLQRGCMHTSGSLVMPILRETVLHYTIASD